VVRDIDKIEGRRPGTRAVPLRPFFYIFSGGM